jgi:hypothetical protein
VGNRAVLLQHTPPLGHAVLAYGPIFASQPSFLGMGKDFGKIVGQAQACVAAGSGLAQKAQVFGSQLHGCANVLGGCSITLP